MTAKNKENDWLLSNFISTLFSLLSQFLSIYIYFYQIIAQPQQSFFSARMSCCCSPELQPNLPVSFMPIQCKMSLHPFQHRKLCFFFPTSLDTKQERIIQCKIIQCCIWQAIKISSQVQSFRQNVSWFQSYFSLVLVWFSQQKMKKVCVTFQLFCIFNSFDQLKI